MNFAEWRRMRRARHEAASGFDAGRRARVALGFLAFGVCIGGVVMFLLELSWGTPLSVALSPLGDWFCGLSVVFCVVLTGYYAHLLFGRLQCSLMELIVLVGALGSAEGLLFSTPGIFYVPRLLVVVSTALPAAVFQGAVIGLIEARLLDVGHSVKRMLIVVANVVAVFGIAGFTLALIGCLIPVSPLSRPESLMLGALAVLLAAPGAWCGHKAKRTAKKILGET